MYIGTDFNEKTDLSRIIDKTNFTFSISSRSIPYQTMYGVSYMNSYNTDVLRTTIFSAISRLKEQNLSVDSVTINRDMRTIDLNMKYNGQTVTTTVDDTTTGV